VFCAVIAVIADGAEDAEAKERLEIGLDAGAPAGVGARDGERYLHKRKMRRWNRRRIS
jgi:hypothetical protein